MTLVSIVKGYYSFAEAASRLECSEYDLRHFVMEGELTPSSFINGKFRLYQMVPSQDYAETGATHPSEVQDNSNLDDVAVRGLSGFFYLVLPKRTSVNQCEFGFAAKLPFDFDEGDILYGLDASIGIDEVMTNGVVMATELDRFWASKALQGTPSKRGELSIDSTIDPSDLPAELDAANLAFRAVTNGYGDQSRKPRIRLIDYLKKHHPELGREAVERIATVANPIKTPGGMKRDKL